VSEVAAQPASARKSSSAALIGSSLVLVGRILALVTALFLLHGVATNGANPFYVVQPVALAMLMLVGAFARRSGATLLAFAYVLMFLIFLILRPIADETFIPVHYDYPILFDRVLFLGSLPMVRLQDLFHASGEINALDLFLSGVYITYFVAPHLIVLAVWRTRPQLFPKAVMGISLCFIIGLFFYFAVPTAPPWLASEKGDIEADVVRILPEISAQLAGDTYDEASRAVGENDVAAMPSLHTALTTMVALIMASYGRRWRFLGITYVALMATALVYLGEHYVIDEIAGIALAVGVWRLVSHHRMFAWARPRVDQEETPLEVSAGSRAA